MVHINIMKSGHKEISYHGAIGGSVDRNACDVVIFKEIWANDASALQALASVKSRVSFLSTK